MAFGTTNAQAMLAIAQHPDELEEALKILCARTNKPVSKKFKYVLTGTIGSLKYKEVYLAIGYANSGGVMPEDSALTGFLKARGWVATDRSNARQVVLQPPMQKCTKCPLFLQCKLTTE